MWCKSRQLEITIYSEGWRTPAGLGTRLPWDEVCVIKSLSDSTIQACSSTTLTTQLYRTSNSKVSVQYFLLARNVFEKGFSGISSHSWQGWAHESTQANRIKPQRTARARPSKPYKSFQKVFILFAWVDSCGGTRLSWDEACVRELLSDAVAVQRAGLT